MRLLANKLRSRSGSSILLALMFLLIVTFVGSSVLVSATGNAGRLNKMRERRQRYLSERSAAMVLRDQLVSAADARTLTIEATQTTTTVTTVGTGTTTVDTTVEHFPKVTPPNADKCSQFHELMFQAAIAKRQEFMGYAAGTAGVNLPVSDRNWKDWAQDGPIPVTPTTGEIQIEIQNAAGKPIDQAIKGAYSCEIVNDGRTILFRISFEQLSVVVRGDMRTTNLTQSLVSDVVDGNQRTVVKNGGTKTVITWQKPTIVKGGD